MPLNRLTAFLSNRAVSRSKNLNAVERQVASGQRSRAAYALRQSEPARQKSLWAYRGALFLARGGYAERLARPPTVFGYMPAMADAACRPENAAAAVALS
jgi:hypothetical protein